jgi:hypothetical protein
MDAKFDERIAVYVSAQMLNAVTEAARATATTTAGYGRSALLQKLRADGFDVADKQELTNER